MPQHMSTAIRNSFVLRSVNHTQNSEVRDVIGQLLGFGEVQKLDLQHWRELGLLTASFFDTRHASMAFDHFYLQDENQWEVVWSSEQTDVEAYCALVQAEDLTVADPSQYGDMANISTPPEGELSGTGLTLLIQFYDSRAAKAMRAARSTRKQTSAGGTSDLGSHSTDCSFVADDFTLSALVSTPSTLDSTPSSPLPTITITQAPKDGFEVDCTLAGCWQDPRTTLMIKNIPNKLTQARMLQMVDEVSGGTYDFFYLPIDLRNRCNVGYAFINFVEPSQIIPFYHAFHGAGWKTFNNSSKICHLTYARIQGKQALMKHFASATLPKNPAMRPLFRSSHFLQPLALESESTRHRSCNVDMAIPQSGLLVEPSRARSTPTTPTSNRMMF